MAILVIGIGLSFGFLYSEKVWGREISGILQAPYASYPIGELDPGEEVCASAEMTTWIYLMSSEAYNAFLANGGFPSFYSSNQTITQPPWIVNPQGASCIAPPGPSLYHVVITSATSGVPSYRFSIWVLRYPFRDWWQLVFGIGLGLFVEEVADLLKKKPSGGAPSVFPSHE